MTNYSTDITDEYNLTSVTYTPLTPFEKQQNNVTEPEFDYAPYDRALSIISFINCLVIVTLNLVVVVTLVRRRHRERNRLHFYIIHLGIADLGVGLISVFKDGILAALEYKWFGGEVLCRFTSALAIVVTVASNNLLIGMSVDRYLVIRFPMKIMRIGSKLDKALVLGAWVLSALLGVFPLVYVGLENNYCSWHFPEDWFPPYITTVAVIVYIFPTIVIVTSYTGICVIVWRKWRNGQKLSESYQMHPNSNKNSGLLPRAKVKSIKMTVIISLAFFVCWTPYFVSTMVDVYSRNTMHPGLYQLMGALYPLNSAANPLIFILFNLDIFCKSRKRRTESNARSAAEETQPTLVTST